MNDETNWRIAAFQAAGWRQSDSQAAGLGQGMMRRWRPSRRHGAHGVTRPTRGQPAEEKSKVQSPMSKVGRVGKAKAIFGRRGNAEPAGGGGGRVSSAVAACKLLIMNLLCSFWNVNPQMYQPAIAARRMDRGGRTGKL